MKKLLLIIAIVLMSSTSVYATEVPGTSVNDDDLPGYEFDYEYAVNNSDYDRIYKDDGKWYGVIEETHFDFWAANTNPSTLDPYNHKNVLFIEFSRDTEELIEISYRYTIDEYCPTEIFGICFGDKIPASSGTETAFNKYTDGFFLNTPLFGESIFETSGDTEWDYYILSENDNQFSSVELLEYTYVLTDVEVDALLLDIQDQYNYELYLIENDDSLTESEKTNAVLDLQLEYDGYNISYGDELTSDADGDTIDDDGLSDFDFDDPGFSLDQLKEMAIYLIVIIIVALVIIKVGTAVLLELFDLVIMFCFKIADAIYKGIKTVVIEPLIIGLDFILSTLFGLIFWWIK
jgi:hypothetical protein